VASPTWRMPRPNRKRGKVVLLGFFQRIQQVLRRLLGHAVQRGQLGQAQRYRSGSVRMTRRPPAGPPACRPGPRCPPRGAGRNAGWPACAARRRTGRRCSGGRPRPPRARPAAAHRAMRGMVKGCGAVLRLSGSTDTTSGITSPARRTMTVSPTRTSLRRASSSLCRVALVTVTPPTNTGRQLGHRRELAGAAHLHVDAEHGGELLLRRVLVRHGPARLARDETQLPLQRQAVDLVDHAVDVETAGWSRSAPRLVKRHQFRSTLRKAWCARTPETP
jgi:hypothetical protein